MKKILLILPFILLCAVSTFAQSEITVDDIWRDYKFLDKRVPGFNFMKDGKHYARLKDKAIKKYDITNGEYIGDVIDSTMFSSKNGFEGEIESYKFNDDESYIMIESNIKSIYRRSHTSNVYLFDAKSQEVISVYDEPIMNATLSPTKDQVVFGFENNLYVKNLASGEVQQITKDGAKNKIIN